MQNKNEQRSTIQPIVVERVYEEPSEKELPVFNMEEEERSQPDAIEAQQQVIYEEISDGIEVLELVQKDENINLPSKHVTRIVEAQSIQTNSASVNVGIKSSIGSSYF